MKIIPTIEKTRNRKGRNIYFIKRALAKIFDTSVYLFSFGYYCSHLEINVKFTEMYKRRRLNYELEKAGF